MNEFKESLKDRKKIETKAIELLSKTKPFREFMGKNSQLASMFGIGSDAASATPQESIAGLQTREQVNDQIQQQIASGGPNAQQQFQKNVQDGQSQLSSLKNKASQMAGGGVAPTMESAEGFTPNNQRTKSFWDKWEYGK